MILFFFFILNSLFGVPLTLEKYIMIDQFGYLPNDTKVAVIVDPQVGFNAMDQFEPGSTYEIRTWDDDETVFSGSPHPWNDGAVQKNSGDRGWWFDFSSVTRSGTFYVYDVERRVASYTFRIASDVYRDVLKEACRMFYYQRLAFPKEAQYAGEWTDSPAFLGPGQDSEARSVTDRDNPSTAKDLSGGWMDAGDYNKYVTFAMDVVHQLLTAFEQNPGAFTDDFNIPESGNGIPDILDEVKFELDWMKKMQDDDGGVIIKMGDIDHNSPAPPSQDKGPRYYGPKCSSSSISAASMFAHAALVMREVPGWESYAEDLRTRAVKAWNWYQSNPKRDDCDDQTIKAGDADVSLTGQTGREVVAGIYLFALTGEFRYHLSVMQKYSQTRPYQDSRWSMYSPSQGDALLYYAQLPDADPGVKSDMIAKKTAEGRTVDIYQEIESNDLYRAFITDNTYHWGSHNPRACIGSTNYDMIVYDLNPALADRYLRRATGILHYFHGVNPLGIVYLTNMKHVGGDFCCMEIFHSWFNEGTLWDKNPAPGYVPGGPNASYSGTNVLLKAQPPQKAYLDFNDGWPVNSWEITEPAIYYQASYIKLLSKFVGQAEDNSGSGGAIESHLKIGNFPNPFRDETTIHYMLASDSRVTVAVFNAFGEKVITLFEGFQQKGAHSVLWNPNTESSGVYVCRATIRAGGKQVERVKKMVLCR